MSVTEQSLFDMPPQEKRVNAVKVIRKTLQDERFMREKVFKNNTPLRLRKVAEIDRAIEALALLEEGIQLDVISNKDALADELIVTREQIIIVESYIRDHEKKLAQAAMSQTFIDRYQIQLTEFKQREAELTEASKE